VLQLAQNTFQRGGADLPEMAGQYQSNRCFTHELGKVPFQTGGIELSQAMQGGYGARLEEIRHVIWLRFAGPGAPADS